LGHKLRQESRFHLGLAWTEEAVDRTVTTQHRHASSAHIKTTTITDSLTTASIYRHDSGLVE